MREGLGLSLMILISRRFVENQPPWSIDELAEQVALPWVTVKDALEVLRRGGLIEETSRPVESFLPARDIAGITVVEVLEVMRSGREGDEQSIGQLRCLSDQARQVLTELEQHAIRSHAAQLTLRELALAKGS